MTDLIAWFRSVEWANGEFLWLLWLLPIFIAIYVYRNKKAHASLRTSGLKAMEGVGFQLRVHLRHLLFILRIVVFAALIIALARPQLTDQWKKTSTEGIDIAIALDISTSMLAADFKPNRLEAAKDVALEFIAGRPNDRIGLVVFAGESFTQCPLTTDHAVLVNLFKDVKTGLIEDGTAIGLGLANAVNRLKDSKAKSRVIILLTDGVNNRGQIAPKTAAEIAEEFGIRVYTVGVGSMGTAPYPARDVFGRTVYQNMEVEIDEESLQQIADITDGRYFRATNKDALKKIYEEIDQLERSKIEVREYSDTDEKFMLFILIAGAALLLELLLRYTIFRKMP